MARASGPGFPGEIPMIETRIGHESEVTLHFTLKLPNGDVVDTTTDKQPATFKVGDGSLLPGFEQVLFGLKAGDCRSFEIEPERGFGPGNEQNIQTIARDQFDEMELEPGLLVIFADAAGGELPGVVKQVHDSVVEVDFNHPLAGKVITFDVEIVDVR
jgi:FKBP-type peptidyl-prolyl cis-trans isomerase SlpA|tara:strand:+ start:4256 stop:4729 length:474 start_codon:yes stop_codon:yes gene_type:complete